jgi:hypothetical protein
MRQPTLLMVLLWLVALPALAADGLTLAFDGATITASDVHPGAQVAFFAVGLVPDGYESTVYRWSQVVTDDARQGAVTFDAGREIPCKSIWVVVDVSDGRSTVAAPPGCPLRSTAFTPKPFHVEANGDVATFLHAHPFLDLLYVHPGQGVWTIEAADGYPSDADGKSDGTTTVAIASAKPLASPHADAPRLRPGGVLVAIDLYSLDVASARLDEAFLREVR